MNYIYDRYFKKFLNKEIILYSIFGIATAFIGLILYWSFIKIGFNYKISNIFSLVLGKLFAYCTNKIFVFKSFNKNFVDFIKEFIRFVISRGLTGLIDYFGLIFFIEILHGDKFISKYFITILVIILNYIFGKKVVFRNGKAKEKF